MRLPQLASSRSSSFGLIFALVFTLFVSARAAEVTDPHITSWVTARSYARVYETASDLSSGNAVSTWPRSGLTNGGGGQATPVYSDIQRVVYSSNYVYVYATGLPSYVAGNWVTPNNMVYTSWPANRAAIHKIPRNPNTTSATKQKNNGSGGLLINGVYVWANGDAQSYSTANSTVSMGGQGIWNRLAGVAEEFNFDPAKGHQPSSGAYHNHVNPIALRYQLGDAVTYNASTKKYSEGTPTKHSPLIGFANDGLPIYGPYGYSTATDSASGVRRMISGFVKRDGQTLNKSVTPNVANTNLASTGRTTLPVWAASVQGKSTTLASTEYGPSTTATYNAGGGITKTYLIGLFAEDYDYLGDLGYTQGTDFDLNRQNVRYCVTPEYPSGTYAYFVCIDSSGNTAFPDIINQEYFGSAQMGTGTVSSITESQITEYKKGGQASALTLTAATDPSGVKLTWPSVEGATYSLSTSSDNTTYATLVASISSAGGGNTTYTTSTLALYYKITLSALASYDTSGNGGVTGVGNSAIAASPVPVAPAIVTDPASQTKVVGGNVTFTVGVTGTAPLSYQWYKGDSALSNGLSANLTLSPLTLSDAGDYHVTVTNTAGSATSANATLSIIEKPSITTQPLSQNITLGGNVTFTVGVSGTAPFTYQWRKGTTNLSDKTSDSLTLTGVTTSDAGAYSVVVSNAAGAAYSATSANATLAVLSPPSITTQPSSKSVNSGGSATFSVSVSGTAPFSYQWYKDDSLLDSATAQSLTINPATSANAGDYKVVVTNSVGSATSANATLTVIDKPVITTGPANQTVAIGGNVTFTVVATGTAPFSYQWRKAGLSLTGKTSDSLTLTGLTTADAGAYSVVVSNIAGSATSANATLSVVTPPSIVTQPVSKSATTGSSVALSVVASGSATLTYQWYKGDSPVGGATSASLVFNPVALANAGDYKVVVTNGGGFATSNVVTLSVSDPITAPTITTSPAARSVLAGGNTTFTVVATGTAPLSYQWRKGTTALEGATADTLSIDPVAFADAGDYSVVVTNASGSATSANARLTVQVPQPAVLGFPDPLPVGTRVSESIANNSVAGLTYGAAGLPSGLAINTATGALTGVLGKTGAYTFTTWAQYGSLKSATRSTTLTVTAFPASFAGSYEGILADNDGFPVAKAAVKIASTGAYTGTLFTAADAKSFPLKGNVELSEDQTAALADLSVARGTGLASYSLHFEVADAPRFAATLALSDTSIGACEEGESLKTYATGVTEPAAGKYTLALGAPRDLNNPGSPVDSTQLPAGSGYATGTLATTGSLKLTGKYADGLTLTGTFSLGSDNTYRVFAKPAAASGSMFAGWLPISAREDDASRFGGSSSDLYWSKSATTTKPYVSGFSTLGLDATLQEWIAPTTTVKLPELLGLDPAGAPLTLVLAGGDVASFTLPSGLRANSAGTITVTDASNPSKFSVTVTASTGAITGSFTLADSTSSRSVKFQGVLLQLPASDTETPRAQGYFILAPKISTDATVSGLVEFALPSAP